MKSFVIVKHAKGNTEYFTGFDATTKQPKWAKQVSDAQLWQNKLHASAQAQLLAKSGVTGVQKTPLNVLSAVLGEALTTR